MPKCIAGILIYVLTFSLTCIYYMYSEKKGLRMVNIFRRFLWIIENRLAMLTLTAPMPLCIYALKLQVFMHKLFPVTFADTPTNRHAEDA